MRRASKVLKTGSLVLLVVLLIAVAGGVWFVRRPWPEISGTLQMPGLQAPVRVVRDTWGVPHIFAENEHDLFMAQGYVHAQDRLWQMEWNRSIANGVVSTIIGDLGIDTDRFTRTLGTARAAQKDYQIIDPEERAMLDTYSAGVNAYIESHRNRLPVQYSLLGVTPRPWAPTDSLAFGNVISYSLQGNHRLELLRAKLLPKIGEQRLGDLLPLYEDNKPLIIPQEAGGYSWLSATSSTKEDQLAEVLGDPNASWGSNNWVVSGSRTATGKPILANDTHLNQSLPGIWYQNGLHGGRFNTVGYTRPGVPLNLIGHTARVAWGITNLNPDVQDLYIEKFNSKDNPTQVQFNNAWEDLTVIPETIAVKGNAPIDFNVYITRHGPIINDVIDTGGQAEPLALRWSAYGSSTLFHSIVLINQASNWDEFRNAIKYWDLPSQNFVYADVDGNIGYQSSGKIPIRATRHQGTVPVPGWSGEYEWQGFIPFEQLPWSFNPPQGFIGTANNKIVDDSYPYSLAAEWDPGYRARRIIDLLKTNERVSVEYVAQMQADTYSLPAEALMPYLLEVEPQSDLERAAMGYLQQWDLRYETDRVGGTIYQAWYRFLMRNTIDDELGDDLAGDYLAGQYERHGNFQVPTMVKFAAEPNNPWFDDSRTPEIETRDMIMQRSLGDAVRWLSEQLGPDPAAWTWGAIHKLSFVESPLGAAPWPVKQMFRLAPMPARGDNFTLDAASFSYARPFAMNHGASQRLIIDLADISKNLTITNTGQSGHPFNPHRTDTIQKWQNVEYNPLYFTEEQVEANAEASLTLTP